MFPLITSACAASAISSQKWQCYRYMKEGITNAKPEYLRIKCETDITFMYVEFKFTAYNIIRKWSSIICHRINHLNPNPYVCPYLAHSIAELSQPEKCDKRSFYNLSLCMEASSEPRSGVQNLSFVRCDGLTKALQKE